MSDKKCVLYISHSAGLGGAEQSLLNALKIMHHYIQVIVVLPDKGKLTDRLAELGISYYIIPMEVEYGRIGFANTEMQEGLFASIYQTAVQISQIIKKEKADLVHINTSVSCVGAMAAVIADVPYVWHIREFLEEDFGKEIFDRSLFVHLAECADARIAISDSIKESYRKKYNLSFVRIYDGLDISRYRTNLTGKNLYNHSFLFAGQISEWKGQMLAVKAANILMGEGYDDVKLYFIGSGSDKNLWALQKYIKQNNLSGNARIMPFVENLAELRAQCTYSITASHMEALGRVTLEAMLAGNIVIGADSGGTLEIIGSQEERGYLFKSGNERSLADAMKRAMCGTDEDKRKLVQNAQQFVERNFDGYQYVKEILKIYSEIVPEEKRAGRKELLSYLENRYADIRKPVAAKDKKSLVSASRWKNRYLLLDKWMQVKQNGHNLSEYLEAHSCTRVAIYGMGYLGRRLYDELEGTSIIVKCVIDRDAQMLSGLLDVREPGERIYGVDAIIIALAEDEETIMDLYGGREEGILIKLADMIDSVYNA